MIITSSLWVTVKDPRCRILLGAFEDHLVNVLICPSIPNDHEPYIGPHQILTKNVKILREKRLRVYIGVFSTPDHKQTAAIIAPIDRPVEFEDGLQSGL